MTTLNELSVILKQILILSICIVSLGAHVCQSTEEVCSLQSEIIPKFVASSRSTYFSELEIYLNTHFKPVTLPNNDVYSGQFSEDGSIIEGIGRLSMIQVGVYTGDFVNGLCDGFGRLVYKNGDSIEGQWAHNRLNGMATVLQTKPQGGSRVNYTGEFVDDKMHGFGIYDDKHMTYEGEWKNHQRHGFGTFFSKKQKFTYIGEHKFGKFDGQGVFVGTQYTTSYTYNGTYKNDKRHGKGSLKNKAWGDEYEYVGKFANDKMHGWGFIKYIEDRWVLRNPFTYGWRFIAIYPQRMQFEGHFVDEKRTNIGRLRYPNGTIVDKCHETTNFEVKGEALKCQEFEYLTTIDACF